MRDRREDLPLLVEHFLKLAGRKLGKSVRAVAPEAVRLLEAHPWPGNVRELQSAVRFAVVQTVGEVVTPECLPRSVRGAAEPDGPPADHLDVSVLVRDLLRRGEDDIYRRVTQAVDRVVLEAVLRHAGGNQVQAS